MSIPTNTRTGLVQIHAARAMVLSLSDRAFKGARDEINWATWGKDDRSRAIADEAAIQTRRELLVVGILEEAKGRIEAVMEGRI